MWKQSRIFGETQVSRSAMTEDENTSLPTLPNSELLHPHISHFHSVPKQPGKVAQKYSRYDLNQLLQWIIYRVSQEECARLRESVPYVKLYRYNPKHLSPKLNGYGDNGKRKVWASLLSTYHTPSVKSYLSNAPARSKRHGHALTLACALQHGSSDVTR